MGRLVCILLIHQRELPCSILRAIVDPNALREALDAQSGEKFNIGEMSDPSEVLMTVYECMAHVEGLRDNSGTPLVDTFFGIRLHEELQCQSCPVVSHKMPSHVEYYLIIPATALRSLASTGKHAHPDMVGVFFDVAVEGI